MIEKLLQLEGKFQGTGTNHEGQPFTGTFEIHPVSSGKGTSFSFDARGKDGAAFHTESSLIGKNPQGDSCLWVLSTNHPGIFERKLKSQDETPEGCHFIFGFGKPEDRGAFREEIHLVLGADSVKYTYFWGMPGGDFAERSGCQMPRC